jgi:hypothetical protein
MTVDDIEEINKKAMSLNLLYMCVFAETKAYQLAIEA